MASRAIEQAFAPKHRGYHAAYRFGETNRCPGCGRSHWHVGRIGAECAFCFTAIPFAGADQGTGEVG